MSKQELRKGIIFATQWYCRFALTSGIAGARGGNPMQLSADGQIMQANVDNGSPGDSWYAASVYKFKPAQATPSWDNTRVMQTKIRQIDNGVAAFRFEGDSDYIEVFFDVGTNAWTGVINGTEQSSTAENISSAYLTFKMDQNRNAEFWVNTTLLASHSFADTEMRYIAEWASASGASQGDGFKAEVRGDVFLPDGLAVLSENDVNWCGDEKLAFATVWVSDTAPNGYAVFGDLLKVQREAVVSIYDDSYEPPLSDTTPNLYSVSGSMSFLQRESAVKIYDSDYEMPVTDTVPGEYAASGTVTFIQREEVEQ